MGVAGPDVSNAVRTSNSEVGGRLLELAGKEFVVTGALESFSREVAHEKVRAFGGTVKDNVTRTTSYLVVGAEPGSKLARAQALGIKQLTEEEFLQLLEDKGH